MYFCPYCGKPFYFQDDQRPHYSKVNQEYAKPEKGNKPRVDVNNIMSTCNQVVNTVSQANQLILSISKAVKF
ncbi:hypothetical protein [Jeotgalibacillus salarius]|uniref:C2H2-type domain-containing protein n=1 Tax=Jeotgalibacillus salarius TaxID=546023 RepID=A0A4Y8LKW6_9BACL|nr:hypothetical protein [Jeotgalibacillus salarius]TFE03049.1 hypothetical protein E2626_04350 [Jeotgalibacillus salarius]